MRLITTLVLFFAGIALLPGQSCSNHCLDFDGTGDYMSTAVSPVLGNANFTVETRFTCTSSGTAVRRLFSFYGASTRFEVSESNGFLRFLRQTLTSSATTLVPYSSIRNNGWHHLAVRRNNNLLTFFVDCDSIFSATFTGAFNFNTFRIGCPAVVTTGTVWWDGLIDEFRVWNTLRTRAQIAATCNCGLQGNEPGLQLYYNFDQTGINPGGANPWQTTVQDGTSNDNDGTMFSFALDGSNSNWVCGDPNFLSTCTNCTAAFSYAAGNCAQTVQFNNQTPTPAQYTFSWNFGDGNTSTQNAPVHYYASPGTYTVTLTATPAPPAAPCTVQQTITVGGDNVPPNLSCKNISLNYLLNPLSIQPGDVLQSVSDNCCPQVNLSLNGQTSFDCKDVCQPPRTVTLVATDCNGNTASCTAMVTILDVLPPTAVCKNINVSIGAGGTYTLSPADVNNGTSDNCLPPTLSVSPNTFGCPATGCEQAHVVTLRAEDCQGNTATCTAQVTVRDVINPAVTNCPPAMFLSTAPGQCAAILQNGATAVDNCDTAPELSFSMSGASTASGTGNGSGISCNPGVTTLTCTATDACGNTGTCSFNVTVLDIEPPKIKCPPNMTVQGSTADGGAVVNWPDVTATDNCSNPSIVQTSGLPDSSFFACNTTTTMVFAATDASFNSATCSFTVTVVCPPCGCGSFTNLTFTQEGGPSRSVKCGDFIQVACPVVGRNLVLNGTFSCAPDSSCAPTGIQLVNSDGTQIGTGSLSGTSFTWSFDGYFISNPGWYELYLRGNCGQQTCQCIVRFVVPECPPAPPCDAISAAATPVAPGTGQQGSSCCYDIQIANSLSNFAASVNIQVVSGGSLSYTDVTPAAGWSISGFSGGTSVALSHSSGQLPVGNFSCGRICLSKLTASPQMVAIQYRDAQGLVICADTLQLECTYCMAIVQDSITCNADGGYTLRFCVQVANTNTFHANALVLTAPTGVNITPAAFSLPNLAPGSTYCTLTATITTAPGFNPDNICIGFTAHQRDVTQGLPPGLCCMITQCFDLPNCCPHFAIATPVDTSGGDCCWKITVNQPPNNAQYVTLNVIPAGSPVTIQSIAFHPNWDFSLLPGLQSATFQLDPAANLPATATLPNVCFDVPAGSPVPQLLEVMWSTREEVLCFDTLAFSCRPDTNCAGLAPLSLSCDPASPGQYNYTVVVTNPFYTTSTVVPTHVAVVDVTPAGALAGTGVFPVGNLPPGSSATISIPLTGTPGTEVCFKLNLYRNAQPNVFQDCCVTEDTFCVTLKACNFQPGPYSITLYPNPARSDMTLDFGDAGSPPLGQMRILDMTGRLLLETEVPAGTKKYPVPLSEFGPGLYLVEFLENQRRVWTQKMVIVR